MIVAPAVIDIEELAPLPILFISFTKEFSMIDHYCREGKRRVVYALSIALVAASRQIPRTRANRLNE